MILATDLDRTLLPNGHDAYDGTLPEFFAVIRKYNIGLIYVTGRNYALFEEARSDYNIELPEYLIGDVGTVIYKKEADKMVRYDAWERHLQEQIPAWDSHAIQNAVEEQAIKGLSLQEEEKQNPYKVSFYLEQAHMMQDAVATLTMVMNEHDWGEQIVYSVDPLKGNIGLIDILPTIATKLTALEFVRKELDIAQHEMIYAGDSGNDILPLTAGYKSIVVKNAPEEVKKSVIHINEEKGFQKKYYIARGTETMNGNYSSGILEGLFYFGVGKDSSEVNAEDV